MSNQSVFRTSDKRSNTFRSKSSDSESVQMSTRKPSDILAHSNKILQPVKNASYEEEWEEVRGNTKKSISNGNKNPSSSQHKQKSSYKQPYTGKGYNKSDAMLTNDKTARSTIHSLIGKLVRGLHIDYIVIELKTAIDRESSHYAKGKLLEVATSYFLHEVLSHELIKPYFSETNVREGDGHTALFWVAWSEYFKYSEKYEREFKNGVISSNPLAGFRRELSDSIATIDLLFDVGYTPTTKNRHNETIVGSLNIAHGEGRIPTDWYEPIKSKYMTLTQKSAEVTLREICGKVSTAKDVLVKHRVLYCFGFLAAPEFAVRLALEFCMKLTPSCIGKAAFWTPVKEKLDMFKEMIQSFDSVIKSPNPPQDYKDFHSAFTGWKSKNQLQLFNHLLSQYTLEIISNVEHEQAEKLINPTQTEWRYDTCFSDPLAGVLGECASDSNKKKYIMSKLVSPQTFPLALYCISHGKFVDNEIAQLIATICKTPEFETNSRLKFALYDVVEKLYKEKIKNISQCIAFFHTHQFSANVSKNVTLVVLSEFNHSQVFDIAPVVDVVLQLNETYCESLKEQSNKILNDTNGAFDIYISKVCEILSKPDTNQQSVIESFMARVFYDCYNSDKLAKFSLLIGLFRKQRIFSSIAISSAIAKMNIIKLEDFFESSNIDDIKCVLLTL
jgi:hypothetical protein